MSQKLYEFLSLQDDDDAKVDFHNTNLSGPSNVIIYVSGNWYDEFKVSEIISLAKKYPDAKILISGGVGRLTLPYVQRMGGEPLYLLERLTQEASACDELSSIKERCILKNFLEGNLSSKLFRLESDNIGYFLVVTCTLT